MQYLEVLLLALDTAVVWDASKIVISFIVQESFLIKVPMERDQNLRKVFLHIIRHNLKAS